MTPAEELRQAAFYMRNPMHHPTGILISDDDQMERLAKLLETEAEYANTCDTPTLPVHVQRALDVARAINPQK